VNPLSSLLILALLIAILNATHANLKDRPSKDSGKLVFGQSRRGAWQLIEKAKLVNFAVFEILISNRPSQLAY
jgi:hypothetical protein